MNETQQSRDLTRTALALAFLGSLVGTSLWVLSPFLPSLVWATMIVVATWPILLNVQSRLGGRRSAATAVMAALLVLVLVIPFTLAIVTIVDNADRIIGWSKSLASDGLPRPPEWVEKIPFIGSRLASEWKQLADGGSEGLVARISPYLNTVVRWFVAQVGTVGVMVLHFLLTVLMSAILYATGETAANQVVRFSRRLAGERGEISVILAALAIRAVALGVVVTAFVQSVIAGVGLWISGVPYAALLTAVVFMLGVAQLGPLPVLIPSVIWLYWKDEPAWGTVLLVITILVSGIDNVLRPILIRKGANLPLLLIFAGVIGGLIAFGIIGLFIGPVVLAVTYTLLSAWVAEGDELPPAEGAGAQVPGQPGIVPISSVEAHASTSDAPQKTERPAPR